ncbi:catalase [Xylophilus sp. Leaf220]|uniref:catalase n=1 Tax=Xylophilus sp. Leaf220 TaxID=1735686 RepID=UPI0006F7F8D9|nr:catalase [Xylophilus sp. Leaf220]KQM78193.1 hydroperoxidase [Xylophilus sp. Leaf220]
MASTRTGARATTKARAADGSADKLQQLQAYTVDTAATLTTNQALQIPDNHNSLKAGARGPTLMEDFILREKLSHFSHERIPERVVYARGAGAHGTFHVYKALSEYTTAHFLNDTEARTPVFVRFSTATGSRGSADTVRDTRGFAVKFYTQEGNYDLVGSNMPVYYIQDAIKFPDLVHAMKPEPHHEMPQAASAHDTFWDFASLMPETTHMLMWAMSDRALPRSLRMMEGFGVHTFRMVNGRGETHFVKFHWKPRLGLHGMAFDEAQKLAGKDPDFHRRDLWEAIDQGHFPEWELGLQVVSEDKAESLGVDLLDPTKLIPEELVPVQLVGRLVLNRNPDNFFAETEQAAFHPAHLVPGIDFSNDPLLQGRLFAYTDSQLARLGGPNFHELPINRSVVPFHNFQRDGRHRQTINRNAVAYEPNSLGSPTGAAFRVDGASAGFKSYADDTVAPPKQRRRSPTFDDHYSQATLFWNSMAPAEKEHIVAAFRYELGKVGVPVIRQRMVDTLAHVDPRLAKKVAATLGTDAPDTKAAAGQAGFREARTELPLEEAPSLSMQARPDKGGIHTRRVAVVAADGVDVVSLRIVQHALTDAGAVCTVVAPRLGAVATAGGRRLDVGGTFAGSPSVMFDAVLVAGGKDSADTLSQLGEAVHFVLEAYKHCKPICVMGEGIAMLRLLGVEAGTRSADALAGHPGVALGVGDAEALQLTAQEFIRMIAAHRFWDRPNLDAIPA